MADGFKVYRTKGGFEFELPEGVNPLDEDVKTWVQGEERKARQSSPEFKAKVKEEEERGRAEYDPTKGMGAVEKGLANLGAGFASFGQGARQLAAKAGIGKGVSDEDVLEKRERDRRLAASTETGAGADWLPSVGSALQFAGETAPTLVVPAGGFARGAQAVRMLPRALGATGRAVADAALAGGAAGALAPTTSDESKVLNAGLGAAGGAVLPLAVAGVRGGRRALTRGGQAERAGERLVEEAGGDAAARQAAADVATYHPRGAEDIPLTPAAITENPRLGMAERGSRARDAAGWQPVDAARNRAVWENVERATANADELADLRAARAQGWTDREAAAMGNLRPRNWNRELGALNDNIEQALRSPQGQNEMRPVLMEIRRQLTELGDEFTPQHLARLRSRMAGAVRGTPDDPFRSAPKSDPFYMSLRDEMDRILNASTGGRWQRVPEGYAAESVPVQAAKSSRAIREAFVSPEGVLKTGERGGAPLVTGARLRQAMAAKGENRFGEALAPESRQRLTATMEALRRADFPQELKASGTGGGGSNTVMDAIAAGAQRAAGGGAGGDITALVRGMYNVVRGYGEGRAQGLMDQALRDPQLFVQLIEDATRRGAQVPVELTTAAQLLARSAGAGLPALMQAESGAQ